jgi:LmbE family N-acetylglucosaminyl deacetylase
VAIRGGEDRAALEILDARQVVLAERDLQYHPLPGRQPRVTRALAKLLAAVEPEECAVPIGIGHPDHILARFCCLALVERYPRISWRAYTDLPYGLSTRFRRAERSARESIAHAGFAVQPYPVCRDEAARRLKQRAVACYPSQIRGLTSPRTNFILTEQTAVETYFSITSIASRNHQLA